MKILQNFRNALHKLPYRGVGGFLALFLTATSCQQEYLNPSAASETQATGDINGLITLCNGLQFRYTTSRAGVIYNAITASGLTTRELTVLNAGNTDEELLRQGANNVTNANAVLRNLWSQSQLVKANADLILRSVDAVQGDAATKASIRAYASIFRALSLGTMAQFWQQIPVATTDNAPFLARNEVFQEAIRTLESAATALGSTAPPANFTSRIVPGISLSNTIQALIARYALMVGDNDKAIAAASRVDLAVRSVFSFDDNAQNPIFFTAFSNRNVTEPVNNLFNLPAVLARPEANDRRLAFYFRPTTSATLNLGLGFFTANNAAIPVYLAGEMLLIRAEANARKGDLAAAVTDLNRVLTKTPTTADPVGAGLTAYTGPNTQAAILTEIYRQRCMELFMSGMRLEDTRRFNRVGAGATGSERNRNWYPYPLIERTNNTSTPMNDPAD